MKTELSNELSELLEWIQNEEEPVMSLMSYWNEDRVK